MPDNKQLIVTLILGIVIGLALFSLMGNSFSSNTITIPSGHQSVVDKVSIIMNGLQLHSVCTHSGSTQALSILPLSFTASGSIKYSVWEFRSSVSDVTSNFSFLTIYGPDDSGNTYWVEVSRATPNSLILTYPTGTFNFNANGNDGYCYFEIQL